MKRVWILLFGMGLSGLSGLIQAQSIQPPEIAARSFVLFDLTSNQTLGERNADAPADPASLTKLMTAYMVFAALRDKKINLAQTVSVSNRAWEERKGGGSLMFIDPSMRPKVEDLLRGMIIQSGNDASVALAEAVGGSVEDFVSAMNRQAQTFGLKNTTFKNVTGLTEPGHVSTARDLAFIATRIIRDFPDYYPYYSIKDFTFNNISQANRNLLLRRDSSVDGMKTGFTEAAGYCLIASAERDFPNGKRRLLSVVLNAASMESRAGESQKLLNWGYQAFDAISLLKTDKSITTAEVWKGAIKEVPLRAARSVVVSVPRGDSGKLQTQLQRTDPLIAPLDKDQRVGTVRVTNASGVVLAEVPLVTMESVAQASFFGRMWDAMRLWIK